jgi:hypothetical protein
MSGYEDHRGPAAAVVFDQAPGNVEPALIAQADVDQDDIRAELRCSLQRLRRGRGQADDAQPLAFQEIPSSLEKQGVVIHNHDTERHTDRIPVRTAPYIAASRNLKAVLCGVYAAQGGRPASIPRAAQGCLPARGADRHGSIAPPAAGG